MISTDLGVDEGRFSATRDSKARWAAIYSPQGFAFGVDLGHLAGVLGGCSTTSLKWTQSWYSPRNGSFVSEKKGSGVGAATFQPPTGGSVDNDWVLLLDDLKISR